MPAGILSALTRALIVSDYPNTNASNEHSTAWHTAWPRLDRLRNARFSGWRKGI